MNAEDPIEVLSSESEASSTFGQRLEEDSCSDSDYDSYTENRYRRFRVMTIGEPTPKPSPRFNTILVWKGRHPTIKRWTNNPAEKTMLEARAEFQRQLASQTAATPPFPLIPDKRVWIKVWFCKRPPDKLFVNRDRSRPKEKLLSASANGKNHPFTRIMKPDTDNCVKFLLDTLSTIGWKDDYQISMITAYRCYDADPPYEGRTVAQFAAVIGRQDIEVVPHWGRGPVNL